MRVKERLAAAVSTEGRQGVPCPWRNPSTDWIVHWALIEPFWKAVSQAKHVSYIFSLTPTDNLMKLALLCPCYKWETEAQRGK